MNNIHTSTTQHSLTAGMHTLRLYVLDAGLVLQKLVLSREPLLCSYFGPEESFCKLVSIYLFLRKRYCRQAYS
ncbi:hypothetical protein [Paenibacillus polymyxa]|uniref:hypothetical protein n=1 Tax=Paenibacillus polymyxa TaxID=1406 RepID=UPI001EE6C4D2|nr:hypothetical protein [Paenibacillus polymyxa]